MEQFSKIWDERQTASCTYCGGNTLTRDHNPSRILLDEPYPENLPVVPACDKCNCGFSSDEEYLACLIECVLAGSVNPLDMARDKIRRTLTKRPALTARLAGARSEQDGTVQFFPEAHRVKNVILKLARGHALFELNDPQLLEPANFIYHPLASLSDEDRIRFECPPYSNLFPEVGSRAMQRGINIANPCFSSEWVIVQENRYRYLTAIADGVIVRIVLSEYLACEIRWA